MVVNRNELPSASDTVATAVISKIHNMPWLKHHDASSYLNMYKKSGDAMLTALPPKGKGSEEISGKKKKSKKKNQKKTISSSSNSLDIEVKMNDQLKEDKRVESSNGIFTTKETQQPVPDALKAEQQTKSMPNVWISQSNVAQSLFPNATAEVNNQINEDEALAQALAESICTAMDEGVCMLEDKIVEKTDDAAAEKSDTDDTWGKITPNLPKLEPKEEECQESDANNDAGGRKITKTSLPPKKFDNNGTRDKSEIAANAVVGKTVVKQDNEPLVPSAETKFIDEYDRCDGLNERHMYMGRGARRKESQYIQQKKQEALNRSNDTHAQPAFQSNRNDSRNHGTNDRMPDTHRKQSDSHFDRTSNRNIPRTTREPNYCCYYDNDNQRSNMGYSSRPNRRQPTNGRPYNGNTKPFPPRTKNISCYPKKDNNSDKIVATKPEPEFKETFIKNNEADSQEVPKDLEIKDSVAPQVTNLKLSDFNSRYNRPANNASNTSIAVTPVTATTSVPVLSPINDSAINHISGISDNAYRMEETVSSTVNPSPEKIGQPEISVMTSTKPTCTIPLETLYANLQIYDPLLYKLLLHSQERQKYFPGNITETCITTTPEIDMQQPEVPMNPILQECSSSDNTLVQHTQKLNPLAECYNSVGQHNLNPQIQYQQEHCPQTMNPFTQTMDNFSHVPQNPTSNEASTNQFYSDLPRRSSPQSFTNIESIPNTTRYGHHQNLPFHETQRAINVQPIVPEYPSRFAFENMIHEDPIPFQHQLQQLHSNSPMGCPQVSNSRQQPHFSGYPTPLTRPMLPPYFEHRGLSSSNMIPGFIESDPHNYVGAAAGSSGEYYSNIPSLPPGLYPTRHPPGIMTKKPSGEHRGRGRGNLRENC